MHSFGDLSSPCLKSPSGSYSLGTRADQKPGIFPSEMTAGSSDQETHKSDLSDTEKGKGLPAGRPGQETDMAAATLYLASYGGVL